MPPEDLVRLAEEYNCQGISYTYTEPTIFFEYAYDTAILAHEKGLFNAFVTNGYMTVEAVKTISPYLDAATVDFKGGGDPEFYRKFSSVPTVEPIYATLKEMKENNIHVEVTNLIVPDIGGSMERIRELATWLSENLGKDTPSHLLRYHPNYKSIDRLTGWSIGPPPDEPIEEPERRSKELENLYDIDRSIRHRSLPIVNGGNGLKLVTVDLGELDNEYSRLYAFLKSKIQGPITKKGELPIVVSMEKTVSPRDVKTYVKRFLHREGLSETYRVTEEQGIVRIIKRKRRGGRKTERREIPPSPYDTLPYYFPAHP